MTNGTKMKNTLQSTEELLTVIMPVYNEEPTILNIAVESVLRQTFSTFKLLLVNDGSSNIATTDTLRRIAMADCRIELVEQENIGLAATLNKGIELAKTTFVARHDSDDWSELNRFQLQIDRLLSDLDRVALVGSWVNLYQENGKALWTEKLPTTSVDVLNSFPSQNPFCHGATLFNREKALSLGGYREQLSRSFQDYDFFWRFCEKFGGSNLSEALYNLRYRRISLSSEGGAEIITVSEITRELARMRANTGKDNLELAKLRVAARLQPSKAKALGNTRIGDRLMLAGSYEDARKAYRPPIDIGLKIKTIYWIKILRLAVFRLCSSRHLRRLLFRR